MDDKLTTKQRLFVEAYLANPNATEAARRAGYSEKTAYSQGQRLLKNVEIRRLVESRIEEAGMTADEVLRELSDIGRAPWNEFFEYKISEDDKFVQMRLTDKLKALELLGKYRKLFTDKSEVSGPDGKPIETTNTVKIELIDD